MDLKSTKSGFSDTLPKGEDPFDSHSPSPPPYILPAPPSPSAPMFPMCVHCGYGSAEPVQNLPYPCGYYHSAHIRCHAYYTTNAEDRNRCIVCKSENCTIIVYDSSEQKHYTQNQSPLQYQLLPQNVEHLQYGQAVAVSLPAQQQLLTPSMQDRCARQCVYIYVSCCCILITASIITFIYAYSIV